MWFPIGEYLKWNEINYIHNKYCNSVNINEIMLMSSNDMADATDASVHKLLRACACAYSLPI